ncbi:dephospho-CoA kinase [Muricomes intestini]|jgi:dephospho-CoA kinase|uniref:Dephospho-CoA kinase n=1 Tax=Muricomes intestini TaxID=1796634 RepID=A0A4R3KA57_9FIRM|nr:dephospho-CoA kinase [Muricomes intestini]TCS79840.1 dephospho-CoA kinase [Muricomes intestini]HAX51359.1 dephospho-CoA kinase [Lachnospiraceae bacterium]HCR82307.1 dephospho-CoA kinase [Lachnospiraceae bacterium]
MKVLGITGGIGSGKSEVLSYMKEEYGAAVSQLDEVAKELQRQGTDCYRKIIKQFGNGIIKEDGELDRKKLAEIIFQDEKKRKILNKIVHPEVKKWVKQDIIEKKKMGVPLYVIEAALLPEAGYENICDELWYIYTEEAVRRERLKKSRGYSDEAISRMILSQSPESVFREVCRVVIDNSGTFEETKEQIGEQL